MNQKKIKIEFEKTCECDKNHINCLTAKEWLKHQLGVWQFYYEKRDIRDKEKHPATYPISLARKIIELFTHKGELVLDPFNGSGTTIVAAKDTDRNAIGFDINEEYCNLSKARIAQENIINKSSQIVICDDARKISNYLKNNIVSLSITSPPYANLLNRKRKNKSRRGDTRKNNQYMKVEQYSQNENDLGILGIEEFETEIYKIYKKMLPVIKPGAHVVINIADMWWEGNRVPLHISIIRALEKAGYIFRNTIIWDRTNIVNRIGIFGWPSNYITMGTTFEFILDFIKPKDVCQ
jgi:DNA modification methylase